MSAPFTTQNIIDLQEILNLNIDQLEPDSELRQACLKIEDMDTRLDIDKTQSIQEAIDEIKTIDTTIVNNQKDITFSGTSISIPDEYSVSYQEASQKNLGYNQRRNELINNIRRDLGIGYNFVSGRLVRR